jgi:hypothetical protein
MNAMKLLNNGLHWFKIQRDTTPVRNVVGLGDAAHSKAAHSAFYWATGLISSKSRVIDESVWDGMA